MTSLEKKLADQILKEALKLKSGNDFDTEKRGQLIINYNELISAASKRALIAETPTAEAAA